MSHRMRFAESGLAVATLLAAAGCAAVPAPASMPVATLGAAETAPTGRLGTIVALRTAAPEQGETMRARILGAVGAGADEGAGPAVEFVVRTDDGQTVSVMQSDPPRLLPGERVMLSGGPPTRIEPAQPGV